MAINLIINTGGIKIEFNEASTFIGAYDVCVSLNDISLITHTLNNTLESYIFSQQKTWCVAAPDYEGEGVLIIEQVNGVPITTIDELKTALYNWKLGL